MKLIRNRNQFTYLDIRLKTWKSIIYVGWLLLISLVLIREVAIHTPEPKLLHSPIAPAWAFENSYAEPTLNPNLTEREQNIELIKKIWGKDAWTGLQISRCESGYRTHAVGHNTNGTIDEGVFQENSVHNMPDMQVATANISYAYTQYLKQGVNPWYSSRSCWSVVLADK